MATVSEKLKALGIGVKGPVQQFQENDPYGRYIAPGGGAVRGEPMTPEILEARRRYQASRNQPPAPIVESAPISPRVDMPYTPQSANPAMPGVQALSQFGLFTKPDSTPVSEYLPSDGRPSEEMPKVNVSREVRAVLNGEPVVQSNIVDWMLQGQRERIAEAQKIKRLNKQREQEEYDREQRDAISKVQEAEMAVAERIVEQEKARKANQLVADMEKALGEKQRELEYLRGQRQASGLFGGVPYSGYQPSPYNYVGDYSMSLMPGPDYSMSPVDSLYPNAMIPEYYLGDEGLTAAMLDPNSGLYDESFAQTYNNPEYYNIPKR
jgi:hypothetical protein